jgi:hypothetical protein
MLSSHRKSGGCGASLPIATTQEDTMTKPTDTPENPAADAPKADAPTTALAAAEAVLIAGYKPPVGVAAGVAFLREKFDESAYVLNTTKGPKGTRITEISSVLVEINGIRRVIEVQGFESGNFKLFGEIAGKTPEALAASLGAMYPGI